MSANKDANGKVKKFRIFSLVFWILVLTPLIIVSVLFYLIADGRLGFMPSFEELENPKSNLASEIYSSDQKLLGKFYIENRTFVNFEDLSQYLVNALKATEDARFEDHAGIDSKAVIRVLFGVLTGTHKGGGSTITQQLSKNLFPRDTVLHDSKIGKLSNLVLTKFKEWVTSVKLERNYTKEEIIVMYVNTVPYGSQTFGIKSAARTFFDVTPDSLKLEQAALLIGVLKAPTYYSPVRNPERAVKRREVVLSQMHKYGYITDEVFDSVNALPLGLKFKIQDHKQGYATYFREFLRIMMTAKKPNHNNYGSLSRFYNDSAKWENDPLYGWCNKNLKPDGTPYNLYKDGLKIYTTINYRMQEFAEKAVAKHLGEYLQKEFFKEQKNRTKAPFAWNYSDKQIEGFMQRYKKNSSLYKALKKRGLQEDSIDVVFNTPVPMTVFSWDGEKDTVLSPIDSIRYYKHFLHAGFMSFEPHTGYVRAYVGGINYKHFQFDNVVLTKRQVGSTFKPFLYSTAMIEGYSPCYEVPNIPVVFSMPDGQPDWSPHNAGKTKRDGEMVSLMWGLANSVNCISAWLMKQFSANKVLKLAEKMGVEVDEIPRVPSICLGTPDISVYEMVGAYGTFASKGVYTKPIFVTRIEDKNGNVLQVFTAQKNEAMSEEAAYLMLELLKGVVKHGTSVRLWLPSYPYQLSNEIAGKTGTTDDYSDGWFIGITPNLVSGGWVGGEERNVHFRGMTMGQGATMALPIWAWYMKSVYADSTLGYLPGDRFERPMKQLRVETDCAKYRKENKIEDSKEKILIGGDGFD
ncbi:MAG: transglycosylase domain-containing protein [Bacteroidetes bacterium]|nr:transglycosylase domain-containing protein [Bacteroidota bacterium]